MSVVNIGTIEKKCKHLIVRIDANISPMLANVLAMSQLLFGYKETTSNQHLEIKVKIFTKLNSPM